MAEGVEAEGEGVEAGEGESAEREAFGWGGRGGFEVEEEFLGREDCVVLLQRLEDIQNLDLPFHQLFLVCGILLLPQLQTGVLVLQALRDGSQTFLVDHYFHLRHTRPHPPQPALQLHPH